MSSLFHPFFFFNTERNCGVPPKDLYGKHCGVSTPCIGSYKCKAALYVRPNNRIGDGCCTGSASSHYLPILNER